MRHVILKFLPLLFVVAMALNSPATASQVFNENGLAIGGYDPVAYFTKGAPARGSADHSYSWNGATWRFASAAHLETFKNDPEKYAPQYGGYCAWAVSRNYTASINPDAWHIEAGKLYLNFSKGVQRRWAQDISGNITRGDENWPTIRAGL